MLQLENTSIQHASWNNRSRRARMFILQSNWSFGSQHVCTHNLTLLPLHLLLLLLLLPNTSEARHLCSPLLVFLLSDFAWTAPHPMFATHHLSFLAADGRKNCLYLVQVLQNESFSFVFFVMLTPSLSISLCLDFDNRHVWSWVNIIIVAPQNVCTESLKIRLLWHLSSHHLMRNTWIT